MAFINDLLFDNGLDYADLNGVRLDICSSEPLTYAKATTANDVSLGSATVNVPPPEAAVVDGRRVVIPAINDGTVSNSGTATHWALSKTSATTALLATGQLTGAGFTVTAGNSFTLDAISITIRDAIAV